MRIDPELLEKVRQREIEDFPEDRRPRRRRRTRGWLKGCLIFFLVLLAAVAIILAALYFSVKIFIGPINQKLTALPDGFPAELSLYEPEQAAITWQNPDSQAKIISLLQAAPDWLVDFLFNHASDDLKKQLAENFGASADSAGQLTAASLKQAASAIDLKKLESLILSWSRINQGREMLADYYKEKLTAAGFAYQENLSDYQINLGFWKEGVFGTIDLRPTDSASTTQAKIMINYLKP